MARPERASQYATGANILAPTRGWNAQDPIAAMKRGDAYLLDNWVVRPGYITARRGYLPSVTGFTSVPETLLPYRAASASKLFAAAGDSIFDVSSSGALGAANLTGLANARWQWANFANDAGVFLIAVNGADTPLKYDGSAWATTTITGSVGSITLDPTALFHVTAHKRRLFFLESNSLRVWFLATDAIAGSAGLLDLGPVFQQGGVLVGAGVWSSNASSNNVPLATIAFVTDQGEAAVYQGEDPSDSTKWTLSGVYRIGKPLGPRAVFNAASDLVVITHDGATSLSVARDYDLPLQSKHAVTSRIMAAFSSAARSYGDNFGWEAFVYPAGNMVIINVPTTEDGGALQFVQDAQTGGWSRFTGIWATTWAYHNGQVFFAGTHGTDKGVYRWDTGSSDNGTAIQCDCITAFEDFGRPGRIKHFTMLRPILRASSMVNPAVDMLTDFAVRDVGNVPDAVTTTDAGVWGSGLWGVAQWTASTPLTINWTGASGVGITGAARIKVTLNPASSQVNFAYWNVSSWNVARWGSGATLSYPETPIDLLGIDVMFVPGGAI